MKQRISANSTWKRYIFAIIALCCIFYTIQDMLITQHLNDQFQLTLIACALLSLSIYYIIRKRKDLYFDQHFLYINNTKKIPFDDIDHLRLMIYRFNNAPTWKIVYQSDEGNEKVWLISSEKEEKALNTFFDKIKKEHPHISINKENESIL